MPRTQKIATAIQTAIEELEINLEQVTDEQVVKLAIENGFFDLVWDHEMQDAVDLVDIFREPEIDMDEEREYLQAEAAYLASL